MAIYIDNKNRIKDILINVNGEKKNVVSAWVNKDGVPTKVFQANKGLKIVTWADGTDDEIAAMLDAHYAGIINIHDYWHVGDERVVHLSAMDAYANLNNESHVAQDVTMVLMNEGGKTLVASINGVNECAFIVGQKEVLSDHIFEDNGLNIRRYGYMNDPSSDDTLPRGWYNCERRIWCNTTYRDALPLSLKRIFKQHINVSDYNGKSTQIQKDTIDYFALPSEKEVLGTTKYTSEMINWYKWNHYWIIFFEM